MTEEDHQEIIRDGVNIADERETDRRVPQDRAGVVAGEGADVVSKYAPDKHISITEIIANKQKKKQLYVARVRKNSLTGKSEYQLKESKESDEKPYCNGKWFPEKEIRLP